MEKTLLGQNFFIGNRVAYQGVKITDTLLRIFQNL